MRPSLVLAVLAAVLVATTLPAQVPEGWYVVSVLRVSTIAAPGGVYVVHPLHPGSALPIANLDPRLDPGLPGNGVTIGANSVLIRPPDGALLVGEVAASGSGAVNLHLISLSGLTATSDVAYPVGVAASGTNGGQIAQAALLPNGDVVVAVSNLAPGGPLTGTALGILSLATGSVVPVPVTLTAAGTINAVTADGAGTTIFFGLFSAGGSNPSPIYALPLTGGTPLLIASAPGGIFGLAFDAGGGALVAATTTGLHRIDLASGSVTTITTASGPPNAVAIETVTGDLAVANSGGAAVPRPVVRVTAAGSATVLSPGPVGDWGVPSGIAVNPTPKTYGAPTPGQNIYSWALTPNPGGLPYVGNLGFSLTLMSAPGCAPGYVGLSLAPISPPVIASGVQIHIHPAFLVVVLPIPCATPLTLPLQVPNVPGLAGISFFVQAAFAESGGVTATDGLFVTIL